MINNKTKERKSIPQSQGGKYSFHKKLDFGKAQLKASR